MFDALGDRMKNFYENRSRQFLTRRVPVIIRIDGKCFHSYTKNLLRFLKENEKINERELPYISIFKQLMESTAEYLYNNIQGVKCAYTQSDEISLVLSDMDTISTEGAFNYNRDKLISISASMASAWFNYLVSNIFPTFIKDKNVAVFDSRAFSIPCYEVGNYIRWRYKDWVRNSIQLLAQHHFSSKKLHGKCQAAMHEMLHTIGVNWADLDNKWKNGTLYLKKDSKFEKAYDIKEFMETDQIFEYFADIFVLNKKE